MADDPAAQQLQQALAQINALQQQLQAMQQQLNNQPAQQGQDAAAPALIMSPWDGELNLGDKLG